MRDRERKTVKTQEDTFVDIWTSFINKMSKSQKCKTNHKTPETECDMKLFLCRWISFENGSKLVKLVYIAENKNGSATEMKCSMCW